MRLKSLFIRGSSAVVLLLNLEGRGGGDHSLMENSTKSITMRAREKKGNRKRKTTNQPAFFCLAWWRRTLNQAKGRLTTSREK